MRIKNPFPIQILWARTHSWIHFPKIISRCEPNENKEVVNFIIHVFHLLEMHFINDGMLQNKSEKC